MRLRKIHICILEFILSISLMCVGFANWTINSNAIDIANGEFGTYNVIDTNKIIELINNDLCIRYSDLGFIPDGEKINLVFKFNLDEYRKISTSASNSKVQLIIKVNNEFDGIKISDNIIVLENNFLNDLGFNSYNKKIPTINTKFLSENKNFISCELQLVGINNDEFIFGVGFEVDTDFDDTYTYSSIINLLSQNQNKNIFNISISLSN